MIDKDSNTIANLTLPLYGVAVVEWIRCWLYDSEARVQIPARARYLSRATPVFRMDKLSRRSRLPKKQSLGHVRGPEIDQLRPENSDTRPEPARSLDIIIIINIIDFHMISFNESIHIIL